MGNLSKHFNSSEFACKCGCGFDSINVVLVARLEEVREHFNSPTSITSGCRCQEYNRRVGGASKSQHLHGKAADIQVNGVPPNLVAEYCDRTWDDGGLGRYNTFTHIDVRDGRARW